MGGIHLKIDGVVYAVALHNNRAGIEHLGRHPLLTTDNHVIKLGQIQADLLGGALLQRDAAGIKGDAGGTVKDVGRSGYHFRFHVRGLVGAGAEAETLNHLAGQVGCDKGGHPALAFVDVDIDIFRIEGFGARKEGIQQERLGAFHLADNVDQGAGFKQADRAEEQQRQYRAVGSGMADNRLNQGSDHYGADGQKGVDAKGAVHGDSPLGG